MAGLNSSATITAMSMIKFLDTLKSGRTSHDLHDQAAKVVLNQFIYDCVEARAAQSDKSFASLEIGGLSPTELMSLKEDIRKTLLQY